MIQKLEQTVSLKLSPVLIQSMELMQMNSQELREFVNGLLEENPMLDEKEVFASGDSFSFRAPETEKTIDINELSDNKDVPSEETLLDHLRNQLEKMILSDDERLAAEAVIGFLDNDGYIEENVKQISQISGIDEGKVKKALLLIQSLEPAGVGAGDFRECLLIQIERRKQDQIMEERTAYDLAETMVKSYLEEIAAQRLTLVASRLQRKRSEISDAMDIILSLNPRPGKGFYSDEEKTDCIFPDISILKTRDGFEVRYNDDYEPHVCINPFYERLKKETEDAEVREYLEGKSGQAKWLINAINLRRETLIKCASCIVSRQKEFFESGPENIRPLTMLEIADELELHESTVSRTLKGKYISCQWGTFPFSSLLGRNAAKSETDQAGVSSAQVQKIIADIIAGEDSSKPLSDQKICDIMCKKNIDISRRTVAKYRAMLRIPPASERKLIE